MSNYRRRKSFSQVLVFGATWAILGADLWAQENPTFYLLAVKQNNVAITPTASINANRGDVVEVEIYLRCWSNGDAVDRDGNIIDPTTTAVLNAYQAKIPFAGYFSGQTGNVMPKDWAITSGSNGLVCLPNVVGAPGLPNLANAFVNQSHPDFVFAPPTTLVSSVVSNVCEYSYIGSRFTGPTPASLCPPPGTTDPTKYGGTLKLQVSPDAGGTFTICFNERNESPLENGPDETRFNPYFSPAIVTARIVPVDFECLTIIVPVDPCDITINSINPPSNTIDGREPHPLNDAATAEGIMSVDLTYTVVNNPGGGNPPHCLGTGAFELTSTNGTAPTVSSVTPLTPTSVRVNFNKPIPAGAWTTIKHTDDSGMTSFCLGSLPLDVNSNRTANGEDIMRVVDCLAGTQSCSIVQGDINRSSALNVGDIVQAINLANGANAFAEWNGSILPPSPCP